jgi:hypothetical protein
MIVRIPRLTLATLCAVAMPGLCAAQQPLPASHVEELGPHPHRPPPEAFSACEGKAAGDACQVTLHDRTLDGSCVAPQQDELFCLPKDMPPPPPGGGGPGGAPAPR